MIMKGKCRIFCDGGNVLLFTVAAKLLLSRFSRVQLCAIP